MRSGEVDLCVQEWGEPAPSRPTVVLVHGYPDNKEVWSLVAPGLAARGLHVVAYDVRGHGDSGAPVPLRGGFTLERLTDDFLAVLDAVAPTAPVHLVGHDWGSVQGWEFATTPRTRGRLASFTSVSGPSLDHFGHWIAERRKRLDPRGWAQLVGQGMRSWYVYALHVPVLPELFWRGPLGARWPRMLARVEKLPPGPYPTASLPQDAAHGAWLYRDNVRARLTRPRPEPVAHCPVQLVTPTGDVFLSPRLYDDLDRWAPGLVRRTVPAGHWLPRTRPDQLVRWIGDFTAEHPAPPSSEEAGGAGATVLTRRPRPAVPGGPRRRPARGQSALRREAAERFGGQLVLVTGGASGIGRATALAFARAGARVIVADRDAAGAARTVTEAEHQGAAEAWAEVVDVADATAMAELAERTATGAGVVDVLVNNAGIGFSGAFLDTTVADWRQVLDVNLMGVVHGCRAFGAQMAARRQGGHIVNTASAAAYQPSRTLPAYSTSKAAVLMLSECLRAELAGRGIGVSAVCPGIVRTPITATARFAGASPEEERRMRERVTRWYGIRGYPPERVADAVLRAVLRDQAVVAVTPEARGARFLSRAAPKALRALARVRPPL
ncbi:SDR family oxidoreductase [Streptomyces sp. NPDC059740]|uniref:SDR family oxidoreductase n=1 Tax=Streptomyces sp. NPDC059740 TaxID=3346926 RepID=UPI0036589274